MLLAVAALCLTAAETPPNYQRLYPDAATASSFLQNNWNKYQENYHPNYAVDDDPATAWVEGADGDGLGESLTLPVSNLRTASSVKLRLRAGYHKSQKLFDANAVPKELDVTLISADGVEAAAKKRITLPKKLDWQEAVIELPKDGSLSAVKLTIVSTWPGKSYKDTCISDVQVFAVSTVPYNEKVELAKKGLLQAWKKSRLDDAKYFASLPPEYPFASASAVTKERLSDREDQKGIVPVGDQIGRENKKDPVRQALSEPLIALVRKLKETVRVKGDNLSKRWSRVAFTRKTRLPDGISLAGYLENVANYFDPGAFAFFETDKEIAGDSPLKPKGGGEDGISIPKWIVSNARVRYDGKKVREVYFREEKTTVERESYNATTHYLLVFNEAQQVDAVVALEDFDEGETYVVVTFSRDASKIVGGSAARVSYSHYEQYEDPPENSYYAEDFGLKPLTASAR